LPALLGRSDKVDPVFTEGFTDARASSALFDLELVILLLEQVATAIFDELSSHIVAFFALIDNLNVSQLCQTSLWAVQLSSDELGAIVTRESAYRLSHADL
jgi:hypothetical protein